MGLVAGTVGVPAGVRDDDDVNQNQEGLVNYRPLQVLQTQKTTFDGTATKMSAMKVP